MTADTDITEPSPTAENGPAATEGQEFDVDGFKKLMGDQPLSSSVREPDMRDEIRRIAKQLDDLPDHDFLRGFAQGARLALYWAVGQSTQAPGHYLGFLRRYLSGRNRDINKE